MQQILNFFIRNKNFLLFILLFGVALFLTVQSHSYQKSKVVNSANAITGGIFSAKDNVTSYFDLKNENEKLFQENIRLRNAIQSLDVVEIDSLNSTFSTEKKFEFIGAKVINNNYAKQNNYLTLNIGETDSIVPEMAVISSKGIVGIVDNVSPHYATVLSILNAKSSVNAKIKKTGHFGSLVWNGDNPNTVQLIDISRLANFTVGDTITTDSKSAVFPENIPIGKIDSFTTDQSGNYYIIDVALFNDMTSLKHVYIIKNHHLDEIKTLENTSDEQ